MDKSGPEIENEVRAILELGSRVEVKAVVQGWGKCSLSLTWG